MAGPATSSNGSWLAIMYIIRVPARLFAIRLNSALSRRFSRASPDFEDRVEDQLAAQALADECQRRRRLAVRHAVVGADIAAAKGVAQRLLRSDAGERSSLGSAIDHDISVMQSLINPRFSSRLRNARSYGNSPP